MRSQRLLALPQPAHRSLYWLFPLSSHDAIERPLTYARLDMALEGGQGRVISKGNLLGRHVNRMVAGVRHANGRDFWVLTRDVPTREYVAYYLGPRGLDTVGVRSPSAFQPDSMGGLKFSPDGRWLASPGYATSPGNGRLSQVLARFDAATGRVSAEIVLDQLNLTATTTRRNGHWEVFWTPEFSADNHLLYVLSQRERFPDTPSVVITQYDLARPATEVAGSGQRVGRLKATKRRANHFFFGTWGFGLQLTPRAEILILGAEDTEAPVYSLPIIRRPNYLGVACTLDKVGYPITFPSIGNGPNNVNGMMLDTLPEIRHFPVRCPQDSVPFWAANPGCADSVRWDFGDPASGAANRTGAWFPGHRFSGPGTYAVTATFNDGRVLTRPVVVPGAAETRIQATGGGCAADTVQFAVAAPGCVDSVRWDFGDPASGPANGSTAWAPTHVFSEPGTYTVTATLADGRTLQRPVAYDPRPALPEPPNIITPDGDGRNDTFRPLAEPPAPGAPYALRIYNRWGREVFATTDPRVAWTGAGLSAGGYFYYLLTTDCAARPVRWRGPVTLVR